MYLVEAVVADIELEGIGQNCKKTNYGNLYEERNTQAIEVIFKQLNLYNFLSTVIKSNRRCLAEIRARIAMVMEAPCKM